MTKAFKLSFTHLRLSPTEAYPHRPTLGYPLLPVELRHGRHHARVMGLIDSGADDCIFPAALGRLLGLTIEAGKKQPFMGAGALSNLAYFHRVKWDFQRRWIFQRSVSWAGSVSLTGSSRSPSVPKNSSSS